jgi:selenocysteine lyase/cysteine desulfurase
MSSIIYFDNAATSRPKPEEAPEAMARYLCGIGGSPGRSGHRLSIEAGRIVLDARVALATLFGAEDPFRIVFTKNATEALNLALRGLLKSGDHLITSSMEHNSAMLPLRAREELLTGRFLDGLKGVSGVTLYGPADPTRQTALVSFNVEGLMPSEVPQELEKRFSILSRPGLHCAPAAHRTVGTFPQGAVRFGFGYFNTEEEIDTALAAVRELARGR